MHNVYIYFWQQKTFSVPQYSSRSYWQKARSLCRMSRVACKFMHLIKTGWEGWKHMHMLEGVEEAAYSRGHIRICEMNFSSKADRDPHTVVTEKQFMFSPLLNQAAVVCCTMQAVQYIHYLTQFICHASTLICRNLIHTKLLQWLVQ